MRIVIGTQARRITLTAGDMFGFGLRPCITIRWNGKEKQYTF
jgi:hypothetical protein